MTWVRGLVATALAVVSAGFACAQLELVLSSAGGPPEGQTQVRFADAETDSWDLDLYIRTMPFYTQTLTIMLGSDRSTTSGIGSIPLDDLITIDQSSIVAPNPYESALDGDGISVLGPGNLAVTTALGGGADPFDGASERPYGVMVELTSEDDVPFIFSNAVPVIQFRVTRTNLSDGASAPLVIYDAGQDTFWTTRASTVEPDGLGGRYEYDTRGVNTGVNKEIARIDLIAMQPVEFDFFPGSVPSGYSYGYAVDFRGLRPEETELRLTSSDPDLVVDETVPINQNGDGTGSADVVLSAQPIDDSKTVDLTLEVGGTRKTIPVQLERAVLLGGGILATEGGGAVSATARFQGVVGPSGLTVTVSDVVGPLGGAPSVLNIATGSDRADFTLTSSPVTQETAVGFTLTTSHGQSSVARSSVFAHNRSPSVIAWGTGDFYGLGNGYPNTIAGFHPASWLTDVRQVTGGYGYLAAIDSANRLWAAGSWYAPLLGLGGVATTTPTLVPGMTQVTDLGGGTYTMALVRQNGTVWATGFNFSGQLGSGSAESNVYVQVPMPALMDQVEGGGVHLIALTRDGRVVTWGGNSWGQAGLGTSTGTTLPTLVPGLTNIVQVDAGADHNVALSGSGIAYVWGYNVQGQLGLGDSTQRNAPVAVTLPGERIVAVAAGGQATYLLCQDGDLYMAGSFEVRGDDQTTNALSFRKVTLPGPVTKVVPGIFHVMVSLADGRVFGWGANWSYQVLGLNSNATKTPTEVPDMFGATLLHSGWSATFAKKATTTSRRITGTVDLSADWLGAPNETVEAWLYNSSGSRVLQTTVAAGTFSIPISASLANGSYSLYVRGRGWLWQVQPLTLSATGASGLSYFLVSGDIDGDNAVTVFDYDKLSAYFDRTSADSDWLTPDGDGVRPEDADLDGDGAVTVFDYDILSRNFDAVGDSLP